jgi:phosphatidylglycerophosphate synthase
MRQGLGAGDSRAVVDARVPAGRATNHDNRRMPVTIPVDAESACAVAQRYSPRPLTEGELWTVRALWELRRGRYRPRAWRAFIASSLERSAATCAARPPMVRQVRRWRAVGAGAWIWLCYLTGERHERGPGAPTGLGWWLLVCQMLNWHLGMAEGGDGIPRERLAPADAVTLTRFWLVPVVIRARHSRRGLPTAILLGGLTDWLDGVLARGSGRTRLGRDLDSTADLAILAAGGVAASASGRIAAPGAWALGARYVAAVLISGGAVLGRCRRPAIRARPWGAALRVGGLAASTAGWRRSGTVALLVGAALPPRSTAPRLSRA